MGSAPSSTELDRVTHKQSWRQLGRYAAGGLVAFLAIAFGIYFGFSYAIQNASGSSALMTLNQSFLDPGDSIPDYRVRDQKTFEQMSLSKLTHGRPAVIMFVNSSCGACETMAGYWTQKVLPHLRDDIRVITICDEHDHYEGGKPAQVSIIPDSDHAVTIDRELYKDQDGINITPTVIAVTAAGRIAVITSGFSRLLTAEVLNKLL